MICSAAGWWAVFGTDPETQTRRPLACWQEGVPAFPGQPMSGTVSGLVAVDKQGGLVLASLLNDFAGYEHESLR